MPEKMDSREEILNIDTASVLASFLLKPAQMLTISVKFYFPNIKRALVRMKLIILDFIVFRHYCASCIVEAVNAIVKLSKSVEL